MGQVTIRETVARVERWLPPEDAGYGVELGRVGEETVDTDDIWAIINELKSAWLMWDAVTGGDQ